MQDKERTLSVYIPVLAFVSVANIINVWFIEHYKSYANRTLGVTSLWQLLPLGLP